MPCRNSDSPPLAANRYLRCAASLVLVLCAAVPAAEGASVEVLSEVLRLDASDVPVNDHDVAALPDGGWIAVWEEGVLHFPSPDMSRVVARRFDPSGEPVGTEWVIATDLQEASPRVAVTAEGRIFCVAWHAVELLLRCPALDDADAALAVEETVVRTFTSAGAAYQGHDVSGREIVWAEANRIHVRPLPQDGGPLPPARVSDRGLDGDRFWYPSVADGEPDWQTWAAFSQQSAEPTLFVSASGTESEPVRLRGTPRIAGFDEVGLLAWVQSADPPSTHQVVVQAHYARVPSPFDPFGPRRVLDERFPIFGVTAAYAPPAGTAPPFAMVGWVPEEGPFAYRLPVQLLDVTGFPLGPPIPLLEEAPEGSATGNPPVGLALHRLADGRFLATWTRGYVVPLAGASSRIGSQSQSLSPLHGRLFAAHPGLPEILSLAGGRFAVTVEWTDPYRGGSGVGRPRPVSRDTGALWFFRPDNLELLVKVLDGRAVNGHWWLFYGGLSSVELTITVDDLFTGRRRTYHKPPFELASAADTTAFAGDAEVGAQTVPATGRASIAAADTAGTAGPCTAPTPPVVIRPGLCLHDRFEVEVEWATHQGTEGVGQGEPLSGDSGYLWFFHRDNAELLVKVLDGRPVNGHWWVFSGALSNVGYDLVVRDTESGEEVTFSNPQGTFHSFADTLAFR